MHRAAFIVLLCVLSVACGEPRLDAPEPLALEPASVEVDTSVEVVIRGRHFLPRVEADYGDRERSQVDGAFSVRLGEHALEDVTFVSTTELRGRVPAGLARGRYSLVVVGPGGDEGRLADAFEVLARPATQLVLVTPERTVRAGACSGPVEFEARDELGFPGRLDVPLDVALTVFPAEAISFFADANCLGRITNMRLEGSALKRGVYFSGTRTEVATLTATSSLGAVAQRARVIPGPVAQLVWDPIPSPRQAGEAFDVSARALDAFMNLTDENLNASLDVSTGRRLRCDVGCNPGGRVQVRAGVFRARVAVEEPALGVRLTLKQGEHSADSNAFDVTGGGGSPGPRPGPPLRLLEFAPDRGGRETW